MSNAAVACAHSTLVTHNKQRLPRSLQAAPATRSLRIHLRVLVLGALQTESFFEIKTLGNGTHGLGARITLEIPHCQLLAMSTNARILATTRTAACLAKILVDRSVRRKSTCCIESAEIFSADTANLLFLLQYFRSTTFEGRHPKKNDKILDWLCTAFVFY